jgi:TolB-like protein
MPPIQRATLLAASVAAALLAAACGGGPTVFRHPTTQAHEIRTIAVLPFEDLATTDRRTAERVRQLTLAELQARKGFEVVEPGLVENRVAERSGAASALPDDLKSLGASLHADGLLMGTILSYTDSRGAAGGEATIQLRLVETRSGATVWTASHSASGSSFAKRFFGMASDSGAEVARAVIRSELATLPR